MTTRKRYTAKELMTISPDFLTPQEKAVLEFVKSNLSTNKREIMEETNFGNQKVMYLLRKLRKKRLLKMTRIRMKGKRGGVVVYEIAEEKNND
ncbi:MAG: winged helix DNA-binding protein [Candidatus Hodarchaeales archaeon]|jgi:hypothetical protein